MRCSCCAEVVPVRRAKVDAKAALRFWEASFKGLGRSPSAAPDNPAAQVQSQSSLLLAACSCRVTNECDTCRAWAERLSRDA
jgi:hypothetical protein